MVSSPILHKDGFLGSACRMGLYPKGCSDNTARDYQLVEGPFCLGKIFIMNNKITILYDEIIGLETREQTKKELWNNIVFNEFHIFELIYGI